MPSTPRRWRGLFAGKKTPLKAALARPETDRRPRQYLCLRGPASRRPGARTGPRAISSARWRARKAGGKARARDSRGAGGSDRGRRLVPARSSPGRWVARLFPAQFSCLRSRRRGLPEAGCGGMIAAAGAEWPLDLLSAQSARNERRESVFGTKKAAGLNAWLKVFRVDDRAESHRHRSHPSRPALEGRAQAEWRGAALHAARARARPAISS